MNITSKIKYEANDLSKWFKIGVAVIFAIYLLFWFFTISLHDLQKNNGITPLLPVLAQDSEGYYNLSQSLASGNGFSQNGKTETLRTPGYPLFAATIKIIGGSYFFVTLVQIFLVFGSAFIVRKIGIILASKKVGEIAAFLFLINPVTLTLSLIILTDTLFLFLFTLGLYLALSLDNEKFLKKIIIVSLIFAAAIYVRLGIFLIPAFVAPILTLNIDWKSKIKFASVMVVIILLAIAPWIYRNYEKVGIIGFTSAGPLDLSWMTTKFLSSVNNTDETEEYQNFLKSIGLSNSDNPYDIRFSGKMSKAAEKIIFAHPFSYLKYHIISSLPFLFPSTVAFALDTYNGAIHIVSSSAGQIGAINSLTSGNVKDFLSGIMKSWWKVVERLCWLMAYVVSLFGIWQYRKKILVWALVFTVVYLMLLTGPAAGPRYTFQALPAMFLLFALGAISLPIFNKNRLV